ncbi:MAG: ADP-ribosylglycohydrolase family protein [Clostridia bacterium]
MYGAILGDIVGSKYEFSKPQGFNAYTVNLFTSGCRFTDDTVLTVATKYAILNDIDYAKAYKMFGNRYRKAGYGDMFLKWLDTGSQKGYNSYGNGSAMRVSFIGEYFNSLEEVEKQAELSSICTHDHPRGIAAARATAGMIYLAKNGYTKKDIEKYLRKNYRYKVCIPLVCYKPFGKFDATADGSMPIAIRCFLESDSWESCMRKAFSIKCDTDTVCCISGSVAEAFYGTTKMPNEELVKRYLITPGRFGDFDKLLYEWAIKKY